MDRDRGGIADLVCRCLRLGNNLEDYLSYETESPSLSAYRRPSRDLQFDYVNTAAREAKMARMARRQRMAGAVEVEFYKFDIDIH